MKKYLFIIVLMMLCVKASAQIYDGKLPSTTWRVFMPIQTSYESPDGKHSVTAAPQIMYRQNIADWLAVEGVVNYNINNEVFSPKIWLGITVGEFAFIQRNNYNCKTELYDTGLSGTWKHKLVGIDFTWDNIFANKEWLDKDRLQFVATFATPNNKWNFNAGYSCRYKDGFVANVRYNIQNGIRLQGKLDCGTKNIQCSCIWDFNN